MKTKSFFVDLHRSLIEQNMRVKVGISRFLNLVHHLFIGHCFMAREHRNEVQVDIIVGSEDVRFIRFTDELIPKQD